MRPNPGVHPRERAKKEAGEAAERDGEGSSGATPSYPADDAGNDPYRMAAT